MPATIKGIILFIAGAARLSTILLLKAESIFQTVFCSQKLMRRRKALSPPQLNLSINQQGKRYFLFLLPPRIDSGCPEYYFSAGFDEPFFPEVNTTSNQPKLHNTTTL